MIHRRRSDARRLTTVLFTDMVGSTEQAIALGDRAWRALLRRHHRALRAEVRRFGGYEVDSAGDGFFITFPQPAEAVRCALAIRAVVRPLGVSMRSGIHTGEVEPIGPKVGGVAVHLAARVLASAEPDEILVTSTVRELVAGSELTFAAAGARTFKGFAEEWHVFRVTGPEPTSAADIVEERAEGDPSRARRLSIALGAVIGGVLVIGLLVVLGVTDKENLATAGPNTVVRIDAANTVANSVSVARAPIALAAGDGMLWVASEAGTITRVEIDGMTSQVVGGVGIPTALAVGDGFAWVAQGYEGRMARVDAASVELRDSLEIHARRLAVSGGALWATDDLADRVVRLSTVSFGEEGVVELEPGSGPRGIAADGDSLWVGNERSSTLVQINLASMTVVGRLIALGSRPSEVTVGGGSVWVTSMDDDVLIRVDPELGEVAATINACDEPDAVAASDEGVWIACRTGRVVRRFSTDGSFVADVEVPGVPSAMAVVDGAVWVALRGD